MARVWRYNVKRVIKDIIYLKENVFHQLVILSVNGISHAKKESVKAAKILIKTVNHANLMMENQFAFHVFPDISYNALSI